MNKFMDEVNFAQLSEIDERDIIELMNDEIVGKQLPLLGDSFSRDDYREFLNAKQHMWNEHGYGPWAFIINGEFAGWGGLQPEHGEADFALVLHPKFWGWGRKIYNKTKDIAFNQMKFNSITILFPPSRKNARAINRLGFMEEDKIEIDGEIFKKYRLKNTSHL